LINLDVYLLESVRSSEGGVNYERDLASIGDRKNEGGFQSAGGTFLSVFMELMPPVVGFLVLAVIRLQFMVKQPFAINLLFDGLGEMFSSAAKDAIENVKDNIKK